ncbi:hypothetical protein [Brachyspira innocens]|uniref:hypothetical protein n=1 Tax=Brachyspira innocens TaxID=13264 RepID=UPI0026EF0659|nr:hypothetical protein [Brachyspira innocens]
MKKIIIVTIILTICSIASVYGYLIPREGTYHSAQAPGSYIVLTKVNNNLHNVQMYDANVGAFINGTLSFPNASSKTIIIKYDNGLEFTGSILGRESFGVGNAIWNKSF